jgi:CubicO group peptidase (beta-lactamase class C family)
MGGLKADGRIPVHSLAAIPRNTGLETKDPIRLKYTLPEAVGMSSVVLNRIDSVVLNAIQNKAMPGCEILVARNGSVVYQKSFGTHTYARTDTVRNTDLYDIASVTKIAATALATMRLYERNKINLKNPASKYLGILKKSNKKNLTIEEMLSHNAGLKSWIPFYKETLLKNGFVPGIFSPIPNEDFSVHVADSLYMNKAYTDTVWKRIADSPVEERGKYVYSDLGPIIMKAVIDNATRSDMKDYLSKYFYKPLKLTHTAFNPLERFSKREIVPTENDTVFRKQLLRGYVHDPAAAMLGGVSGNAGLFSNSNDLAIIMQMLLNKGTYGGIQFLKPETVEYFTRTHFANNRRGLLFDKPETDPGKANPCAAGASPLTFGHQGFTGTCVWADPQYGLIYIFLSNRVHPDAGNDKLSKTNVRTALQEIIYKSLTDFSSLSN